MVQPDRIEPVTPDLHADGALRVPLEEVPEPAVRHAAPGRNPPLGLLELIAVLRIVEEVGEVREQIEAVAQQKARRAKRGRTGRALELGGQALPIRPAAVGGVEQPEARDQAAVDRALRRPDRSSPSRPNSPCRSTESPLRLSPRLYRRTPLTLR